MVSVDSGNSFILYLHCYYYLVQTLHTQPALRDTNIKQTEKLSSDSDEILVAGESSETRERGGHSDNYRECEEEKKVSEVSSINSAAAIHSRIDCTEIRNINIIGKCFFYFSSIH